MFSNHFYFSRISYTVLDVALHRSVQSPVASLATQYKDGRDSLMDGHSPKSEHNESDSHDKGKQPEIRVK